MKTPNLFFIFDVESIGLHGEGFAVAGGLYLDNGSALYEFQFACPAHEAKGAGKDREWVNANVPMIEASHRAPAAVRNAFWAEWMKAKEQGAVMAVECGWPVEARFLEACVADDPEIRNWDGPYPMHEISTYMLAAGMDPMATYDRSPSQLPAHNPLADARLSAHLLFVAIAVIESIGE